MADTEDISSQVEAVSQPLDNEKSQEAKTSESITQNTASVASQGPALPISQPQVESIYIQQSPQQLPRQHSQVLSSAQINTAISENASPQLFQIQQQPGQSPQTMALINGQLISVAGAAPVSVVIPQVQVQVQNQQTAVNMRASIVQKKPIIGTPSSAATQENTNVSENNPEKSGIASPVTTKPSQPNASTSLATQNKRDRGCGCGFWEAIIKSIQQSSQGLQNVNHNKKNNKDDNQITTVNNNDAHNDNTTSQSWENTAANTVNPAPAPAPAPTAQNDPSQQANRDFGTSDVGQNTNATSYPLGANDINTINPVDNQVSGMALPDTGQMAPGDLASPTNIVYIIPNPGQQPLNIVNSSQEAPTSDPGLSTNDAPVDGEAVDDGGGMDYEGEEDPLDEDFDGMDDMDDFQ